MRSSAWPTCTAWRWNWTSSSTQYQLSDAEIVSAIQVAFKWHELIPENRVHFTLEKSWVTLTGAVASDYQRHNAEAAVRPLTGVPGIVNRIHLRKYEAPDHVAHRIHDALARYGDDEDKATHIELLVAANAASHIRRYLAALLRD